MSVAPPGSARQQSADSAKPERGRKIADTLHLGIKTIESHCEHIKQRLGLASATELARRATQWVENGHTA